MLSFASNAIIMFSTLLLECIRLEVHCADAALTQKPTGRGFLRSGFPSLQLILMVGVKSTSFGKIAPLVLQIKYLLQMGLAHSDFSGYSEIILG